MTAIESVYPTAVLQCSQEDEKTHGQDQRPLLTIGVDKAQTFGMKWQGMKAPMEAADAEWTETWLPAWTQRCRAIFETEFVTKQTKWLECIRGNSLPGQFTAECRFAWPRIRDGPEARAIWRYFVRANRVAQEIARKEHDVHVRLNAQWFGLACFRRLGVWMVVSIGDDEPRSACASAEQPVSTTTTT